MNVRTFVFWTGVVTVAIIVAHLVIEWMNDAKTLAVETARRPIGFLRD
jgi:formate-dependent nitrite reductase membrane component NrfD